DRRVHGDPGAVARPDGQQSKLFLARRQRQEQDPRRQGRRPETVSGRARVVERRAGLPQEAERTGKRQRLRLPIADPDGMGVRLPWWSRERGGMFVSLLL